MPPSHLLAEEQREGWGCMPAEGAVLSRGLRPSGTKLPFPVRSGAASQPGQGRARQSSQNKQNKAGERASRTGPKPLALQSRGKVTPGLPWTPDHIPLSCLCQRGLPAGNTAKVHRPRLAASKGALKQPTQGPLLPEKTLKKARA